MLCVLFNLQGSAHRPAALKVAEADAASTGVTSLEDAPVCFPGIASVAEDERKLQILVVDFSLDTEADDSEGLM